MDIISKGLFLGFLIPGNFYGTMEEELLNKTPSYEIAQQIEQQVLTKNAPFFKGNTLLECYSNAFKTMKEKEEKPSIFDWIDLRVSALQSKHLVTERLKKELDASKKKALKEEKDSLVTLEKEIKEEVVSSLGQTKNVKELLKQYVSCFCFQQKPLKIDYAVWCNYGTKILVISSALNMAASKDSQSPSDYRAFLHELQKTLQENIRRSK